MHSVVHSTMCCTTRLELSVGWCTQDSRYRVVAWWSRNGGLFDEGDNEVTEAFTDDVNDIDLLIRTMLMAHRTKLKHSRTTAHGRWWRRPTSGGPETP